MLRGWGAADRIVRLFEVLLPAHERRQRLIDLALVAGADTLVLYSINEALLCIKREQPATRELLLFALGLGLTWRHKSILLDRAAESLNQSVLYRQKQLLRSAQRLDLLSFEQIGRRALLMRLTTDTETVAQAAAPAVRFAHAMGLVVLSMMYLISQAPGPALVTFAMMWLIAAVIAHSTKNFGTMYDRCASLKDDLQKNVEGVLQGFKQVKQHAGRSQHIQQETGALADALRQERLTLATQFYAFDVRMRGLFHLMLVFIAFGMPLSFPLDEAVRSTLLVSVFYVFRPMNLIFQLAPAINGAASALARLDGLQDKLDGLHHSPESVASFEAPFSELRLQQVTFRYPPQRGEVNFGVGPLDFELHRGEVVFVTGANGSGKSTFLKLVTGLYPRQSGEMLLNGQHLGDAPLLALQRHCAVIFAEFILFERPYGLEHLSAEQINGALEDMGLADAVQYDGERFSTLDLSTGQQKRLAMAMALLAERPLLLLDEWAADQDPVFRARFYQELLPRIRQQGQTVVAITHDDRFFSASDRRVHFVGGQVESE